MGIGRVVATGAIVVTGLAVLGACGWDITKDKSSDKTNVTETFTSVNFANNSGNVTITVGDQPSVSREIHFEDTEPDATHRVEDGVLNLDPCPTNDCWIDYDVVVPEGTKVNGRVDSGNIEISGVSTANVEASSGEVTVRDVSGTVNVEASSGNIELDGIGGAAQVRSSSGNVTVGLDVVDDVRVQASSGNVEVAVPEGAYRVDASADSGDVTTDVQSDDSADHELDLRTNSGDITVTQA